MTISAPLMSKAKKQIAVIQWVTQTNTACRGCSEFRSEAASGTSDSIACTARQPADRTCGSIAIDVRLLITRLRETYSDSDLPLVAVTGLSCGDCEEAFDL